MGDCAAGRAGAGGLAVVTGASGSVGSVAATSLARRGFMVVAMGRDHERLSALPHGLPDEASILTRVCDVTDSTRLRQVLDDACALVEGRRCVLVNAAGVYGRLAPVHELSLDDWQTVVAVNLFAAVQCTAALLPVMLATGWGRVISVSSAASLRPPVPFGGPYGVGKVALNRFTAQVAAEVAGTGVTAHALHPGDIASGMWAQITRQAESDIRLDDFMEWSRRTVQVGETPERAANTIRRLIDDRVAERMNGWFLWPDGDPREAVRLARVT